MRYALPSLTLASVASARALHQRDASCSFGIQISGDVTGTLGQLSDGQNRVGPEGQAGATYTLDGSKITDGSGRGCVVTESNQFQCDLNSAPDAGFSVSSSGQISFQSQGDFWACPVDDNGNYNIYTKEISNDRCVQVTMSTTNSNCAGSSPSSGTASPAPSSSPSTAAAVTASSFGSSATTTGTGSGVITQTQYSTQFHTVISCSSDVIECPGSSTAVPVSSAPTSVAASSAPSPSSSEAGAASESSPASSSAIPSVETSSAALSPGQSTSASAVADSATPSASQSASLVTQSSTLLSTHYVTQTTTSGRTTASPATSAAQSSAPLQSSPSSGSGSNGSCPGNLPEMSHYQAPRLIVPVNQNSPDTSYGTQYNAYIGGGNSTIFNFNIPSNFTGKQCTVILTLPTNEQMETSFVKSSGSGGIDFKQLSTLASASTSYSDAPAVSHDFGVQSVTVGNAYTVTSETCKVGDSAYELSATGDLQVEYFQDYNPCPIGLWIYSS